MWQDLTLRHGWRTAAIVPELEEETKMVSTSQYALNLTWLQALTGLIERLQVRLIEDGVVLLLISKCSRERCQCGTLIKTFSSFLKSLRDPESKSILQEWQVEREELR